MKKLMLMAALSFGLVLSASHPAHALILNYVDSGWYQDDGHHISSNENYIVRSSGETQRNWFVFDLSSVSSNITSAILRLDTGVVTRTGLYSNYDVVTDIATLRNSHAHGSVEGMSIYNDLGTGTFYGSSQILNTEDNIIKDFSLNAGAIADLNNASGLFALGGTYSNTSGQAFSFTNEPSRTRQLVLGFRQGTPVPEPASVVSHK